MKRKPPKPPSRSRYSDDRYSDDYSDRSDSYPDDREDQPKPKSGIAAALN